jgi:hypothetical protein
MMSSLRRPMQIRVDGSSQIDPSQWPEDMDVVIRVGLGSGRKEQRLANRMNAASDPARVHDGRARHRWAGADLQVDLGSGEGRQSGLAGRLRDRPVIRRISADAGAEAAAARPGAMKVQAELQMKQQKHEGDMQIKGADLQGKQQEGALKLELERQKATEAAQLARDKAEFEREQAVEQMLFEREMQQQKFAHESNWRSTRPTRTPRRRNIVTAGGWTNERPATRVVRR